MLTSILRRILFSIPTVIGVTVLAFILIRLVPGDPVQVLLGERGASPEVYQQLREQLGLHLPPWQQYFVFLKNVFLGDLGTSIISKQPVINEFMGRFPATVELGLMGVLMAVVLGIPIGILAAVKRRRFLDYFFMSSALVGYSMPIFWWGLILIIVFATQLGWFPVGGRINVLYDIEPVTGFMLIDSLLSDEGIKAFFDALKHLVLPAVALGTIPLAAIARMTRSSVLEVLREDYIRTAKAKGLSFYSVVVKHALRNALLPIVTVVGLMVGTILTGAILTETIFSWPGIGKWLVHSVEARDYPVIQGGLLLTSIIIITVNLTVDILYKVINPKMRNQ